MSLHGSLTKQMKLVGRTQEGTFWKDFHNHRRAYVHVYTGKLLQSSKKNPSISAFWNAKYTFILSTVFKSGGMHSKKKKGQNIFLASRKSALFYKALSHVWSVFL